MLSQRGVAVDDFGTRESSAGWLARARGTTPRHDTHAHTRAHTHTHGTSARQPNGTHQSCRSGRVLNIGFVCARACVSSRRVCRVVCRRVER